MPLVVLTTLLYSCRTSRLIPDNSYLLDKVTIETDNKEVDIAQLEPYIQQKGNSKWFSLFRIPLATYSLAGEDSTKWINRTLKRIGEEPILFDTAQANLSSANLRTALQNMGYMHATVDYDLNAKRKKRVDITYRLHPGQPFMVRQFHWDIQDDSIARLLGYDSLSDRCEYMEVQVPMQFTVNTLDDIRKQLAGKLNNAGYYRFHKDFIVYDADTISGSTDIALTLHLLRYKANGKSADTLHPRYRISSVNFISGDSTCMHLRHRVLENNTAIHKGCYFSAADLQQTYNNFARLGAVRYTNINFIEHPDSNTLDANIQVSTNKPSTISFQPEGTNTAGNLGVAGLLTYENRNLFRGSELFSIQLRGAFEAITGLEGYENHDYEEYSVETSLQFPRLIVPFVTGKFQGLSAASSALSISWDLQNRPEFHRRVFSAAWKYKWSNAKGTRKYHIDFVDLNYVHMPWINATFKHDYLDSTTNRNAILRYNYEDLFIMKTGFGVNINNGNNYIRANIETAGNLLRAISTIGSEKNADGRYTFLNIAYAQYVKFDFDYTKLLTFDARNQLALHAALGVAYPYGNSDILPFEKRYFSGGPNSVRGWSIRELGPGKFHRSDGRIDFINQTGDMKLDLNVEFRSHLFWKFDGAAFIDAGNIWTLRDYQDQPGGQFRFNTFYEQIAAAYGLGLRLNFGYFILRFDMGMKAINPAYENSHEHYSIFHPDWGRDFTFHFAVGLPF